MQNRRSFVATVGVILVWPLSLFHKPTKPYPSFVARNLISGHCQNIEALTKTQEWSDCVAKAFGRYDRNNNARRQRIKRGFNLWAKVSGKHLS